MADETANFPPLGFYFNVKFSGLGDEDSKFQSVSGLSVDLETEDFREGGENRYVHKLPLKTKYPNLVLKRGLTNSKLYDWVVKSMADFRISPRNVDVTLMNSEGQPLRVWHIIKAYPVKWDPGDFNAEESKLVIESIELTYNYFTVNT